MRAAILSIGDELTLGQNLDTNSAWLSAKLAEEGVLTVEHRTVADDRLQIVGAIQGLLPDHDVLIITGGLGPTADDLTREALGDALTPGRDLVMDEAALAILTNWFTKRGRSMPVMNRKQAQRPASMRILPNPNGTAPGLAGEIERKRTNAQTYKDIDGAKTQANAETATSGCLVFSLPGPPREMQPMFADHVLPVIRQRREELDEAVTSLVTVMVQEFGMGESVAAEKLGSLMDRHRNPLVGTTASDSIVAARIRAEGDPGDATRQAGHVASAIEKAWHPYAFGRDGVTLVDAIAALLVGKHQSLATAESCTGGWLGKAIVDRAGSSAFYRGGWVTYSNQMKIEQLGVPAQIIDKHGAVSRETAEAMSSAAWQKSGADWALSITGIAGPDGGTKEKPIGTVWIALAGKDLSTTIARRFEFPGERATVRDRSVKAALQMLRFALMNVDERTPLLWEIR